MKNIKKRLEYLRGELRKECISYEELAELQSLAKHIDSNDVELLEAAGVSENDLDAEEDEDWSKLILSGAMKPIKK